MTDPMTPTEQHALADRLDHLSCEWDDYAAIASDDPQMAADLRAAAAVLRATASDEPSDDDDPFGDPNEDIDALIVAHLPEKLRERTCPAGLPHTGDDPASDHGHTDCWIMQLAATEIERLRAERDAALTRANTPCTPGANLMYRRGWEAAMRHVRSGS